MRHSRWFFALFVTLLAFGAASLAGSGTARGDPRERERDICGTISTTLTIHEDSRLTCDVECLQLDKQPCINFGRPGIKLDLNRFKMTGTANEPPKSGCVTDDEFPAFEADGIHSKFDNVVIEGPGLVQRMKRHGIALLGVAPDFVEKARVEKVTSHQNCFSGIWLVRVNKSVVEEVVSVRNSGASNFRPCGGICVTNSSYNRVLRGLYAGTGSIAPGPPPAAIPNDFGIGLVGDSDHNLIEENAIGGNINGLALFPLGALSPEGNLIRKNEIVGNPPIEVSADNPAINPVGADIRDFSSPGTNRFKNNLCITYTGGETPSPCAGAQHDPDRKFEKKLPTFAGHENPRHHHDDDDD